MDATRDDWRPEEPARWLAEAVETGNPLAPLPPEIAPRTMAEGEEVAFATVEALGLAPCGLRLAPGPDGSPLVGPMLEGRLLRQGAPVALSGLRHPRASAALIAVLAEDLTEGGEALPAFAGIHPALDLSASRFTNPPMDPALAAADLGGLGYVVAGRRTEAIPEGEVPVTLAPAGRRPRGVPVNMRAMLAPAMAAARRLGGLPAGALVVVAGLGPAAAILPAESGGSVLVAGLGPLGRVRVEFA